MKGTVFAHLHPALQQAIAAMGYQRPTPIQEAAIKPILAGKHLMGCAQTGTGKTAAFALPLLHRIAQAHATLRPKRPLVLILAPTRELAAQIEANCSAYAKGLDLPCAVVFGGVNIKPQVAALAKGVAVLVATPGRLLDLEGQGALSLESVQAVVLDEADRMLDMGFLPDIRKVLAKLPHKRQSLFFSATLSPEVTALAKQFIQGHAVSIRINPEAPTVDKIRQRVLFVDKEKKYSLLKWVLDSPKCFRVIVFPRMKHGADRLCKQLTRDGFPAAALHGDKSQAARLRALEGFRSGKVQVLVATDIAARGIDVDEVTHVINYDLPDEPETYVHRIGRTARAGAEGEAISLVCPHDRQALRTIEKFIGRPIPQDVEQPFHSEAARNAMGADAVRPKRAPQPRPPRPAKTAAASARSKPFFAAVKRPRP
ncbi:MAG: DEAD/DEAH box helicase [Candidatus Spyradenecus sp.]